MTSLIVMVVIYDDDGDDDEILGDLNSDNVVEHENKQPEGTAIASTATFGL